MSVWRDDWTGMPNVTVIAETSLTQEGFIEDALLFVLDPTVSQVALTDEHGTTRICTLPEAALEGGCFLAGIDLHTQQENP